jgi:hypothetical protein
VFAGAAVATILPSAGATYSAAAAAPSWSSTTGDARAASPTEQWVAARTSQGVAIGRRAYRPISAAGVVYHAVAGVLVCLALLWFSLQVPDEPGHHLVELATVTAFVALPGSLWFRIRLRRVTAAVLDAPLPTPGPGEVEARLYAATWQTKSSYQLASLAFATVVFSLAVLIVMASAPGPGAPLLLIFPVVLLLGLVLAMRRRTSQRAVAAGQVRPDGSLTTSAPTASAPSAAGETMRYWIAPVMRVHTPGTSMFQLAGWSGTDEREHDKWAQNTFVVTDRALYLLCILPPEQLAAIGSGDTYGQVKMSMFYSGTSVRQEADRRLREQGMATVAASDGRNKRFAMADVTAVSVNGCQFVLSGTAGPTDTFIVNHQDVADQLVRDLQGLSLPLRITVGPPNQAPAGVAHPYRVRSAMGWVARLVGAGALLFSLFFIGIGLVVLLGTRVPSSYTASATGMVTAVVDGPPVQAGGPPGCSAEASFSVRGTTYLARPPGRLQVSPCPWQVGQPVTIKYDPAAPGSADIVSDLGSPGLVAWVLLAFGGIVATGAVVLIVAPGLLRRIFRRRR